VEITGVAEREDAPTRARVARAILQRGPSTAAALAEELDLTPAAVRRHLDHLVEEGHLEARSPRAQGNRGRGRPAKVFALTEAGRDQFDKQYDTLAVEALRFMVDQCGDEAVLDFARTRMARLEETHLRLLAEDPSLSPAEALARAMSQAGFSASVLDGVGGEQLCQQHCPVAHVAHEFPQLCEAETELISRVLGSHVQRLATIAHGDGVCTTFIPVGVPTHPVHAGAPGAQEERLS
jgi:predicted ArsR family transcriptional regulator